MKLEEAIRILGDTTLCSPLGQAAYTAIEELKEVQQYREMGTVEECREAVEREHWIPVEERLPEDESYILLSFANFSLPLVGRYEQDEDGGAFYIGDEDTTCISQGVFVNAWMPLPDPYRPEKGEW